jgi:multiple sugar transport system substrate-binding protein
VSAKRTKTRLGAAGVIMLITAVASTSSLVAAGQPASGGGSLVVWDFKSGDEAFAGYYTAAEEAFEADHEGVDVEFVAQPFDQYYTLIGTAIQNGEGPDLLMFNGGAQLRDRVDALVPLDDFLASDAAGDALDRLAGWEAFQAEGVTYGVPITIQGIPIYYNKALYAEAGLDPEAPPATWEELAAACEALIAAEITCFAGGNREGIQMEFWLTAMAPGSLTSDEYDAWLAGDRDWTSDNVRRIFQTWADSTANGWFPEGLNSTTMFMDSFAPFQAGETANVIGLMSDVAHWKDFGEFLGDDLGVLPPLAFEGGNDAPFLSAEGGIGYSVTAWSANPELAAELAVAMADTDVMTTFFEQSGAIVSDTTVDLSGLDNEAATTLISELEDARPNAHTALTTAGLDALHVVGQQLAAGEITVDDALAEMQQADEAAVPATTSG